MGRRFGAPAGGAGFPGAGHFECRASRHLWPPRWPRDLDDTIRRLQAYERAGADVLFAPGLADLSTVRQVCASVSKPVNVIASVPGGRFTVADLADAGVKRISLAASLYRAAMTGLLDAAREVKERGTFGYVERTITNAELNASL